MARALPPLPVDDVLPELIRALGDGRNAVLKAPTGAGKTTRVPPALLAAGIAGEGGRIVMLEPRRLAARAAARRMAEEQGWRLGGEVGYQVRFERRSGSGTRILVVTEGLLVRLLQSDPFLEGTAVVIFDEIHERNLDTDLALALTRKVQREARPDLSIVAMSATLDPGPVAAFFGGCPVVESVGRLHPVEVRHFVPGEPGRGAAAGGFPSHPAEIAAHVAAGIREALTAAAGGVLAFLPGVGEIRRTAELLDDLPARCVEVLPLHGSLPPEKQDTALDPRPGRRKVVLATNVAESSVTVPGVTAVVDSGLARVLRYDPASGLDRLELARVSRESADQRSGRAGREGPGLALRLWSEHEDRALPERETPEIARVDLAAPLLQLLAWGEGTPEEFEWLEPPAPEAVAQALSLLTLLGAKNAAGLTSLGRTLANLPLHPRLGRLLVEGHRRGAGADAALAAALLAERDPVRRDRDLGPPPPSSSDLLDRLEALETFDRTGRPPAGAPGRFHAGAARFVLRARDQLLSELRSHVDEPAGASPPGGREEALGRAILAAYPDRLARRRGPGDTRAVMVGGRGLVLSDESAVREPLLFVAVELSAGTPGVHADALVRKAVGIDRAWLPEEQVEVTTEVVFDPERQRVVGYRRERFAGLVIAEAEVPALADEAARVLAEAAAADLAAALPLSDPAVASFLARLRFLAEQRPELGLPVFADDELRALLPALAAGRRSFDELRRAPLLDVLQGRLVWEQRQALEREAPERLEVPSGSRVRLVYEPGRPPVLPVRIQEMFGAAETPRVAGGRVPVLLHLLAPNQRPQQVTDDLAGFWRRTYPLVKKELAGRYPKHAWPDDPLAAAPERRPGRRS